MKKKIIFSFIILMAMSCKSDEYKERIKQLEQSVFKKEIQIKSLKKENSNLFDIEGNLRSNLSENYTKNEDLMFLTESTSWLAVNHKNMLKFFFESTNLEKYNIESALKSSWMFYPSYGSKYPFGGEEFFANHMISKIDRSSESLEKIFTSEVKEVAYSFFNQGNIYKDCGAYAIVKSLLLAYESFYDQKEILDEIYEKASELGKRDESVKQIISSVASKEILNLLSDLNYSEHDDLEESTEESRLVTVYTFWARRYHENNLEFTYSLLQELHQNVTNEALFINDEVVIEENN